MDYGVITVEEGGLTRLGSGSTPRLYSGLDSLFQSVVMELCSGAVEGRGGSGFIDALLRTPPGEEDTSAIYDAFRRARANLFAYQAGQSAATPAAEILKDLQLLDLRPNESEATWEADIQLVNALNESMTRTIGEA